jgi:hypothetical protein
MNDKLTSWGEVLIFSMGVIVGVLVGWNMRPQIRLKSELAVTNSAVPAPSASVLPDHKLEYERDVKFAKCVNKHGVPVMGFARVDSTGKETEWGFVCVDENSAM